MPSPTSPPGGEALPHIPRVQLVVGTMKAHPALTVVVVVDVDKVVEGQFVVKVRLVHKLIVLAAVGVFVVDVDVAVVGVDAAVVDVDAVVVGAYSGLTTQHNLKAVVTIVTGLTRPQM